MDKGGLTIETRTGQSVRVDTQGAEAEGNAVAAALGQAVEVTGTVSPNDVLLAAIGRARQAVVGVLVRRPVKAGGRNMWPLCRPGVVRSRPRRLKEARASSASMFQRLGVQRA